MQTFLPYPCFTKSAACLDRQRLGKQRVEAKQIYLALTQPDYGWQNHPAVKMWRGREHVLAHYGYRICVEWIRRGYNDSLTPFFAEHRKPYLIGDVPCDLPWLTDSFCLSHRSNLIRKLPSHYGPLWPNVPNNLSYIWPL